MRARTFTCPCRRRRRRRRTAHTCAIRPTDRPTDVCRHRRTTAVVVVNAVIAPSSSRMIITRRRFVRRCSRAWCVCVRAHVLSVHNARTLAGRSRRSRARRLFRSALARMPTVCARTWPGRFAHGSVRPSVRIRVSLSICMFRYMSLCALCAYTTHIARFLDASAPCAVRCVLCVAECVRSSNAPRSTVLYNHFLFAASSASAVLCLRAPATRARSSAAARTRV